MKEYATSLTASLGTYCSLKCICNACLSNPAAPPAISQGVKVTRCQRAMVTRNSRKRGTGSCSSFNLNFFLSNTCLLFPKQHSAHRIWLIHAYWIKQLNQYSYRSLGHFLNHTKAMKMKSQSITDIKVSIKYLVFSVDNFFPTLANGLKLLAYEMIFQLWYKIKKKIHFLIFPLRM